MDSSVRRPRVEKSIPTAAELLPHPADAHAQVTRPPDSWSTVASRLASTTGWCSGRTRTPVASRSRWVWAARKASRSIGSGMSTVVGQRHAAVGRVRVALVVAGDDHRVLDDVERLEPGVLGVAGERRHPHRVGGDTGSVRGKDGQVHRRSARRRLLAGHRGVDDAGHRPAEVGGADAPELEAVAGGPPRGPASTRARRRWPSGRRSSAWRPAFCDGRSPSASALMTSLSSRVRIVGEATVALVGGQVDDPQHRAVVLPERAGTRRPGPSSRRRPAGPPRCRRATIAVRRRPSLRHLLGQHEDRRLDLGEVLVEGRRRGARPAGDVDHLQVAVGAWSAASRRCTRAGAAGWPGPGGPGTRPSAARSSSASTPAVDSAGMLTATTQPRPPPARGART